MVALNARLWTRREVAPARETVLHGRTEKLFLHLAVSTVFSLMKIQQKVWENARKSTFSRKCDAAAGQIRPEASQELRRETQPQELQEARDQRPVSFFKPIAVYNHRVNVKLDLVYLGSMCIVHSCTHWLRSRTTPAFGLIYEGAIGQPRYATSLCDPLAVTHYRPVVHMGNCSFTVTLTVTIQSPHRPPSL